MDVRQITVRDRLEDYEFTDEQELSLTLELLNRVEKDIDELRGRRSREGFTGYVALAGFAAVLFLLLSELGKLPVIPFSKVGVVLLAGLLLMKIPWAIYQLLAIDLMTGQRPEKGRFFWSSDVFFEHRIAGIFQMIVFVACAIVVFFLPLPIWTAASTALAFLLYVFILGLSSILSFKKEPLSPDSTRKSMMVGAPAVFLITTVLSLLGLVPRMELPVSSETSAFAIGGLLVAMVFFIDTLIRLSTPSLLLQKLERLRYDIMFLKAEQPLPTPHFDEEAIQNARPAVPLEQIKARLLWLMIVLMCGSALLGGVIGLTISQQTRPEQVSTPATSVAPEASRVSTQSGNDRIVKSTTEDSPPLPQPVADPEDKPDDAGVSEAIAEVTRATVPREKSAVAGEPMNDAQAGDAQATLRGALEEWIAATNARDIQRQMGFYNQKVNAFYLTRNVPREAVRAEKSRVFGRADLIDIKAAAPGIRLSRDGQTATMRFRKKYAIEGGGEDRRGEVVQELRWRRTDDGWKIVSERDLRVIN